MHNKYTILYIMSSNNSKITVSVGSKLNQNSFTQPKKLKADLQPNRHSQRHRNPMLHKTKTITRERDITCSRKSILTSSIGTDQGISRDISLCTREREREERGSLRKTQIRWTLNSYPHDILRWYHTNGRSTLRKYWNR